EISAITPPIISSKELLKKQATPRAPAYVAFAQQPAEIGIVPCWHRLGHAVCHLGIRARLALRQPFLDQPNSPPDLLVGHRLDADGMLQLHLPRHQKRTDFHISRRLLLTHLFNRGRPVLFEVGSEREQEILVERSTCSLQGPARVSNSQNG